MSKAGCQYIALNMLKVTKCTIRMVSITFTTNFDFMRHYLIFNCNFHVVGLSGPPFNFFSPSEKMQELQAPPTNTHSVDANEGLSGPELP